MSLVGSGVVESACGAVVADRLKRGGMRWTVAGANAMLALRCWVFDRRLQDFQRRAGILPRRAHGNTDRHMWITVESSECNGFLNRNPAPATPDGSAPAARRTATEQPPRLQRPASYAIPIATNWLHRVSLRGIRPVLRFFASFSSRQQLEHLSEYRTIVRHGLVGPPQLGGEREQAPWAMHPTWKTYWIARIAIWTKLRAHSQPQTLAALVETMRFVRSPVRRYCFARYIRCGMWRRIHNWIWRMR